MEIGPGRGALTAHLLDHAETVVAIEVDAYLASRLADRFAGQSRLHVLCADVLQTDLGQWGPCVVAGNLPYYISSPIVEKALGLGTLLRRSVFLVQKEFAERLTALPGRREYGYLSVATALFADVEQLFEVKPAAFYPRPQVDSAVVRLQPHLKTAALQIEDPARFLEFVSRCFRQKRKTIRNNLLATYGRDQIGSWPEASLRAEQLPLERFAEMYHRLIP